MALACAKCGLIDGQDRIRVKVVCHHCGKPLCDEHCVWIIDDAFSDRPALTPAGPHDRDLPALLDVFRQLGAQIRWRLVLWGLLAMSKADADRVAYHCETCYAANHQRAASMKGPMLP